MDEMKKEPNNEADEGVPDINDILEIFGITNIDYENEIEIDDGLRSSSTTSTTTTTTTTTSKTTTTGTTQTTTTSTTATSDTREFLPTSSTQSTMRKMDGSKIIFSDAEINGRNKELENRVYAGRFPSSSTRRTVPRREQIPNSQIFFPE